MDFIGILSGSAFIICGLLLLCKLNMFSNTKIAALGSICGVALAMFVASGFKNILGVRPIVPFYLFRNRTILAIYLQNILFGGTFFSFVYFTPITLQVVRGLDPVQAWLWLVPYFVTHDLWTTGSVQIVRWLHGRGGRSYSYVFLFGCAVWTVAIVLLGLDSIYQFGKIVIFLGVLVGLGTGSVFQNSVMAICTQVDSEKKAVALGTRNVLRNAGGALGTAISSAIIRNQLQSRTPKNVADKAFFVVFDLTRDKLTDSERLLIQMVYAKAIAYIFTFAGMMAVCLVLCLLIKDTGTKKQGCGEKDPTQSDSSSTSAVAQA